MARQSRLSAPASAAGRRMAASLAAAPATSSDNTTANGGDLSASLTADELAALLETPVQTVLGMLDRLAEQNEGGTLPTLARWLGLSDDGEGADDELIEAKRTIEDIFATTAHESALFVPLPPLSTTPADQLVPLQQANLVRLVLAVTELVQSTSVALAGEGKLKRAEVELIWQIREGVWREAFSLVGAEAVAVDDDGSLAGDDPLRVGRILASGRKEKERREALLQRRASIMLELCSFTQIVLPLGEDEDPQVDRLSDVFLPTFMGSADQVALPGRERGAVFRSAREKEGLLRFWADEVDLQLKELRELATEDLRLKYNAPAVLERLLAYAVRDIFLPHEAQQMSRPSQHNLFDSQFPGQRMVDSLDDELPPSHQSAGEAFADSQQSIEDTLDNAQVEADLLLEAAGRIPVTAAAAKKGKGKSRKAVLARRQAVEEVVVQETTEVMELAEAMPPQDEMEEGIIDPSLEAEGSGSQSLEYATQDEVAAAAVQASYVDSQESLISSLGAENLWNDFRLQGLPVNEFVQNLAQDGQAQYSQDESSLGGQHIDPSQDDSEAVIAADKTGVIGSADQLGQLNDGSLPGSTVDEHKQPIPERPSARARGKKRAREPSTSSIILTGEVVELASQLGTYGEEEMEQPGSGLDQGGLEPPVKARKENTGRGNSSKSAKGYLYYQGRNETGRKSWRPEEDACLRQAMEQFDGQKMMWSKIIGQHGPKGTVDTILADRTSVSCKDRARNLKTIMLREHVVAPPAFDAITLPKRQRATFGDSRQPSASPSQQDPSMSMSAVPTAAPAPELEEAALSLQSLTSQLHHHHQLQQQQSLAGSAEGDHRPWDEQPPREGEHDEVDPGLMEEGGA